MVEKEYLAQLSRICRGRLMTWFKRHRRALPWRTKRTPYRVWVAEIMLQQTRVDQAYPYYQRFMRTFPSLKALASADRSAVLKAWEGLGYYGRARRLHEAAQMIARDYQGRFPRTYEELLRLPGVGPYTAAAVASLAMGRDLAVVDGNIIRVLSRLFALRTPPGTGENKRRLQRWADELMPAGMSADFNEAMMELGALCCLPRSPQCGTCPFEKVCRARVSGRQEQYPVRKKKKALPHKVVGAGVVIRRGKVLLAQREDDDMLGGMWEFPGGTCQEGETLPVCIARELKEEMNITVEVGQHLTTVHHAYSHFTMELHAHLGALVGGRLKAIECAAWTWAGKDDIRDYAMGRADQIILDKLEAMEILR